MFRHARFVTLFCALFAFSSCAWVLHPERRGKSGGGDIDGVPLIVDLVWLLVGIVPGVVCLAVDFGSGAIYTSGGGGRIRVRRDGEILVRRPDIEKPAQATMRVVDEHGTVLAQDEALWSPEHKPRHDKLRIQIDDATRIAVAEGRDLRLELQLGDEPVSSFGLELAGV